MRRALTLSALALALAGALAWAAVPSSQHGSPRASLVDRLTNVQLAGQRVIYSYTGLEPPQALLERIRAGAAAGVIFFADNISSKSQLAVVTSELEQANASSPVDAPLLLMTDQEGGLVRRLPGAPTLSEKQIGESSNGDALAADAGRGAAANLRGVGLNVNLAPVLDVYRKAGNFIDGSQRSYSNDASLAASLGAAFITAQQQGGVAATAKHFPGLGAASAAEDTDVGPVTLDLPRHELRSVDEAPYVSAIAAGVKLVMVSWAIYPALAPNTPAGLSSTIIGGELRRRLGFRGVTITDAIGAGALAPFGGFARRGLLAARAGADLILCSATDAADDTPALGGSVLAAINHALADHSLSRSAAERAATRVIALRESLGD